MLYPFKIIGDSNSSKSAWSIEELLILIELLLGF
jgi:hypothetical protein